MKKIIITGTDGFVGKNLKNKLKSIYDIIEINEEILSKSDWLSELERIITHNNPLAFFHVGACSDTLCQDVNYMMLTNFEFTKIAVDCCSKNNIPFIYSSSAAVYGIDGKMPSNLYAWSKWVAECYVIKTGGLGLRYFNVYGPGEEHKGRMASVAYQMWQKKSDIKLFPGKPSRDFVFIDDVISANIFAFENFYSLKNNWYDVGSGQSKTFEEVLTNLGLDFTYHSHDTIPSGYQFYTCSNKEKWMPEWESKFDLQEGLQKYKMYLEAGTSDI